jgi:hypothetical protein
MPIKFRPQGIRDPLHQAKLDTNNVQDDHEVLPSVLHAEEQIIDAFADLPSEMFSQGAGELLAPQPDAAKEVRNIWPQAEDGQLLVVDGETPALDTCGTWDDTQEQAWDDWDDANNDLYITADEEEIRKQQIGALWPCATNVFGSELERFSSNDSTLRALEQLHKLAESGNPQVYTNLTNLPHLEALFLPWSDDFADTKVELLQACIDKLEAMLHSLAALRNRSLGEYARKLAVVGCAAAESLLMQVYDPRMNTIPYVYPHASKYI